MFLLHTIPKLDCFCKHVIVAIVTVFPNDSKLSVYKWSVILAQYYRGDVISVMHNVYVTQVGWIL
jgi:hypothetical protein